MLSIITISVCNASECESEKILEEYKPRYAKLFSIKYYKNFKIIESKNDRILIGDKKSLNCKTKLFIMTDKASRFVATSTTHLPFLKTFRLEKSLVGFQGVKYIYNEELKKQQVKDIHFQLNAEELLSLKPDLVMAYSSNLASEKRIKDLRKLNVPIVLNRDFEETHPLARAEWMVFSAAFFSKDQEAKKVFIALVDNYNSIKTIAMREASVKPKILVGDIQNGKWATCGGTSDLAILIADAGGDLILKSESPETQNIPLEKILAAKITPQYWLSQNTWTSKNESLKDSRYGQFKTIPLYNNNNLVNVNGFNDYWETGVSRPDLLLQDLYNIFTSQKNPNQKLIWYKKL